ncbi:N-acetyltransferase DgcN [Emcibacter sp.]|uniref:N-acetyltransferase DgcN n=1 Tax=Emcibacter sp. TaxID=1979954 RepID=UPI002AA7BAED|nr:N-acetyltransferase DgcN [Emcibacter sp.]
MEILSPYLLFLGDVRDPLSVKTSRGIAQWRPEKCIGQFRMSGCEVSLGYPDMTIAEAAGKGAKTFILGLANAGGTISENWLPHIREALECGMDVANGLHQKLSDIPEIKALAEKNGRRIFDVRHSSQKLAVGTGIWRQGKRLLTVGTDCSVGKMYTSLALEKAMVSRGMNVDFRATGQTGILVSGGGISVDAVVADFISGAVEYLSPNNEEDHWDILEGQGSLFHPSYAGVSLGLLHGAQADILVLCHEMGRQHMRGLPHQPLPMIGDCIEANLRAASLTSPGVKLGGISVNTSAFEMGKARNYMKELAADFSVPCVDPLRDGVTEIVDFIS